MLVQSLTDEQFFEARFKHKLKEGQIERVEDALFWAVIRRICSRRAPT